MSGSYFTLTCPLSTYLLYKYYHGKPTRWNRAFISVSAFINVTQAAHEAKLLSSKANKDNSVTWCNGTLTTSSPVPTPAFIFSWVMGLVAEGCVV